MTAGADLHDRSRPKIAAIVPALDAADTLGDCLKALRASETPPDEIIVYDDGSSDQSASLAREFGVRVIRNEGKAYGPAYGRNIAAAQATADLLLFVDADVIVAPTTIKLLLDAIENGRAVAAFGSYDDQPHSRRIASLYGNLRHHYVHQHSPREASTFWSGIGMIERSLFLDFGGFDASYSRPSIEDIDLGVKLVAAGRLIRLVPEAQGTHCKDWTLWRLWHTDIFRRAAPWSRLIAQGRTAGSDLNVSSSERLAAVAAHIFLWSLIVGLFVPQMELAAAAALSGYLFLNRRFFRFLARHMRATDLVSAVMLHWCYHIYSSVTFVLVTMATRLRLGGSQSLRYCHRSG